MPPPRNPGYQAITYVGTTIASVVSHSLLSPVTRGLDQVANFGWSNVPPDIASVLHLFYSERITAVDMYRLAGIQGVHLDTELAADDNDRLHKAWNRLLEISRPTLEVGSAVDFWYQGKLRLNDVEHRLKKAGLSDDDIKLLTDNHPLPDIGTAIELKNRRMITDDDLGRVIDRHGIRSQPYKDALMGMVNSIGVERAVQSHWLGVDIPINLSGQIEHAGYGTVGEVAYFRDAPLPFTPPMAMNMHFRGYLTDEQCKQHLRATQTRASILTDEFFLSMRPMPGPSDLVRFAVREVWDAATVARWGYDREFPTEFGVYMQRQGMGWGDHPADWPNPAQAGITWPEAYWRAHWQPIPVHQSHVAYHILRPERLDRYRQIVPDITAFTFEDLQTSLKVADYAPGVRSWLAATAFTPLRLSQVKQAYEMQINNREETVALMRDRGLVPADAEAVVATWDHQKWLKDRKTGFEMADKAKRENLKHILEAFNTGIVDRIKAKELLEEQFVPPEVTDLILNNVLAKHQFKRFGIYLKKVKQGYMEGTYSGVQVRQFLALLGVVENRAAGYVQDWDLERTVSHKAATTAMILKYVREGLLSPTDGRTRLLNLGWINVDATLAIASAQVALAKMQTRTLAAAERSRAQKAKELQKIQEDMKKERKRIAMDIRRETPIGTLKSWYVNCRITKRYLIPRMEAMLYTQDDIRRYLTDWDKIREEKKIDCGTPDDNETGSNGTATTH
jgi:signal transduction histidine kinase